MDGPKHNSGIPQRLGGFPEVGAPFLLGPHSKEYSIFGSILGSPYFGKLPICIHDQGPSQGPQLVLLRGMSSLLDLGIQAVASYLQFGMWLVTLKS